MKRRTAVSSPSTALNSSHSLTLVMAYHAETPIPPPGFYTVRASLVQPAPVSLKKLEILPRREAHLCLGVFQMTTGALCMALEVATVCKMKEYASFGGIYVGFWFGGVIFLAGFFGFLASWLNSKACVAVCIIFSILTTLSAIPATLVSISGISGLVIIHKSSGSRNTFIFGKMATVLIVSLIELTLSIVQACCACCSCCGCCGCCCDCCADADGQQVVRAPPVFMRAITDDEEPSFEITRF